MATRTIWFGHYMGSWFGTHFGLTGQVIPPTLIPWDPTLENQRLRLHTQLVSEILNSLLLQGKLTRDAVANNWNLGYTPAVLGDWPGDEPATLSDAIDALAARVAVPPKMIILEHRETAGTGGGTLTGGSILVAPLNFEALDEGGHCALNSNQFTLDAGTYRIRSSRGGGGVIAAFKTWLYNVTDDEYTLSGTTMVTSGPTVASLIDGTFTIATAKTFEIRYRAIGTGNFGAGNSNHIYEVYARVVLEKVA